MSGPRCPSCRADTADGLLCEACTNAADQAAADLCVLLPAVEDAACGLSNVVRWVDRRVDRSMELAAVEAQEARRIPAALRSRDQQVALPQMPIPNLDAAALLRDAVSELRWVVAVGTDDVGAICAGLRRQLADRKWWTRHDAPAYARRVRYWARRLEQALDVGVPDLFLGRCDVPDVRTSFDPDGGMIVIDTGATCGADLYARLGDDECVCQACGSVYTVADRREWMLDAVRHVLARPATIARALTKLDMQITPSLLDTWISRDKRLHEQGRARRDGLPLILADPVTDDDGKPVYLVGPVIDRVQALRDEREAQP